MPAPELERAVTDCFTTLHPHTRSADGRTRRDRPDWIARIGPDLWGIELTSFRHQLATPTPAERSDEAAIEARLRAKAPRVPDYRAASHAPFIGLIIHAEFDRRSCRIEDDAHAHRLLLHAALIHQRLHHPFDAVWLLRNHRPHDPARLWQVPGPSPHETA